jgi:spore germination protein
MRGGEFVKKKHIWIISILIITGIIAGFWFMSNRAYSAENALEAAYQRGFYNLIDHSNDLNLLISKSLVTSSNLQKIMTLTTVWHQAEAARNSLAQLPLGNKDMTNSQKFFAQLGDFSYSLVRKLAAEEEVSEEEWSKLEVFQKHIRTLSKDLRDLQNNVTTGKIKWQKSSLGTKELRSLPGMADSFERIDQKLEKEVPSITYDGPFSDHIETAKPKGITGEQINEETAIKIARDFIRNLSKTNYNIKVTGKAKGGIPAYNIEFTRTGVTRPEIFMDISEKGGHILWFMNTRKIESEDVNLDRAVINAKNFLKKAGFENMEATGSLKQDNSVTITFVPKQSDVILYPDYIKVEVALDNGGIVGMDSLEYYTNHVNREIPEVNLTEEEVEEKLNPNLAIKRTRLVIIPDSGLTEQLCFEIDANLEDERFLIYINAINGKEEQILKVVETEDGTMTM